MYVSPAPYTTGKGTDAASSCNTKEFKDLENTLLNVPSFDVIQTNIADHELLMMTTMLSHITINLEHAPKIYLLERTIFVKAKILSDYECVSYDVSSGSGDTAVENAIAIIKQGLEASNCTMTCNCDSHKALIDPAVDASFKSLLSSLQELDCREALKDQSGTQVMSDLFNFVMARSNLSCHAFKEGERIRLFNARPDFIAKLKGTKIPSVVATGEIESSPYAQMVVASLGHISSPFTKYMLGMTISKSRHGNLFFFEKDMEEKEQEGISFCGPIRMRSLSTDTYNLCALEGLKEFTNKMACVIGFILKNLRKVEVPEFEVPEFEQRRRKRSPVASTSIIKSPKLH